MPPSRFASTLFRACSTAASLRRRSSLLLVAAGLLASSSASAQQRAASHAQPFAAQRNGVDRQNGNTLSPAQALLRARSEHLALAQSLRAYPHTANLTAPWQPLGPTSVVSPTYNNLTGRITSIALDPNDATGNTVYLGTTGGGVWKSTNAAGALANATFAPLTDTLPVFSANAGSSVIPSLSIGAVAVQPTTNPVVLAGTGDPNDATDSYYGEGLLRSADGGLTWTFIQGSHDGANGNHSFTGLATAGIAFSTATPTLVVAAFSTSPQAATVNAASYASIPGLYYSTDAGQTWAMATLFDGSQIVQEPQPLGTGQVGNAVTSVVWDALRGQFFAAVRAHGYYASTDGITWTRLTAQPSTNLTPSNCPVGAIGTGAPTCPIFRGSLAVQPATGDLYALTVDAKNLDQGLWQDLCNATSNTCAAPAPTFANRIDNGALEVGNGSTVLTQGSYNLALAAARTTANGTLLYAGTVDLYRCALTANSSACALRNTTNALNACAAPAQVAPAQHALAILSQSSGDPLLFLGNDGGLWRSLDGVAETGPTCNTTDASHFNNLNPAIGAGGSLAEVVGFAQDPTAANTLLAGLGANGSAATSSASTLTPWPQLSAGEGGFPSIDPATPTNWYIAIGAEVNLSYCDLGTDCTATNFVPPATIGEPQVSDDTALLDAPTLLDPALTTNLLTGTCRVWRGPSSSGSAWSAANAISPAFDGSATPCTSNSALIHSLAAGGPSAETPTAQNSGSEVLYAGMAGALDGGGSLPGHLFVTTTANTATSTTAWTDVALSSVTNDVSNAYAFNPGGFDISSITVDPHDPTGATVYATVMGFGVPHLYRSTTFGSSWLNFSANLPDAPANAVLVDPNDANTVYVALDTGVYVTQAVTNCPTTNCWSVLGTALPNAPVIGLAASATLPTDDGRFGMLRASTYGRGIWQQPLLTATTPAQPAITLSATSLTFAAQQAGTQSSAQTITVTSSGNAPVVFGTPAITGDFQIVTATDTCAGQTLAINATCSVQVVFAPAVTGARSGQLTLYANIAGGQATVALNGTGTAPASIVLNPLTLAFPRTLVNQTSAAQDITISNTGGNTATLQSPVLTGDASDFTLTANTCGATLAPSTGCTLSIAFNPTTNGARSATLSIADSAGTQTATLTGTGQSPATDTLTPLALTFAQQQIGTTSAAQTVTLTNNGDVALTLITAIISAEDFAVTNACGNSLAAHSTCAINVTFSPTAIGARMATLIVTDQFRSQSVALSGTGIAGPGVSLSPSSLTFPATGVGLTALAQTLTLTNNGGLPLSISSIATSPGFTLAANTCGSSLAINANCALTIVFAPTAAGPIAGTLTLTDNAPSSTQTTNLTGTGIDFTLAVSGPASVTLPASGLSATYPMLLSSLASLSGNVALSCTGAPANATCNIVPSIAPLGGTSTVSVTVETGVAITSQTTAPLLRLRSAMTLALLLPLAWCLRRKRAPQLLALITLVLSLATLPGCGALRTIPGYGISSSTGAPTPVGTYTLTVSATSAGITHSVPVQLIVQ